MHTTKYLYPFWGSEHLQPSDFFETLSSKGFDRIEINIPKDPVFETAFYDTLYSLRQENPDFICGLQQVFGVKNEPPLTLAL